MTSIAPRRAAYRRRPSALTARAAGAPGRFAAPTGRSVARSKPMTRVPAAAYPREPSGAAAAARLTPPTGTRVTTRFVATSVSVAVPSPVATSTTRAQAAAGASRQTASRAGRIVANRRIEPCNAAPRAKVAASHRLLVGVLDLRPALRVVAAEDLRAGRLLDVAADLAQ